MLIIKHISTIIIPIIFLICMLRSFKEKIPTFDLFIKGAKEGIEIVFNIFPTLIGLFFAIELLKNSGVLDLFEIMISPITKLFSIPSEIIPLVILRPISGSASLAIATDIIKNSGVDSFIGVLAAIIMGSTETTLYTIAVYTSSIKIKKTRYILVACLIGDFVGMVASIIVCKLLF